MKKITSRFSKEGEARIWDFLARKLKKRIFKEYDPAIALSAIFVETFLCDHFELSGRETKSGCPEVFEFVESDFDFVS